MSFRVCSIEDDPRYRESLRLVFSLSDRFELVRSFSRSEDAIAAVEEDGERWDVVLMDLDLPGMDGVEATRRLRQLVPALPIVVLTAFDDPPRILRAIRSGARGYLLKRATGDELIDAVEQAIQGGAPLSPSVARSVLQLIRDETVREPPPTLAPRERDVLEALVAGRSYKQIAYDLGLSIDTVRGYVRTLYRKLEVHSATEAVSKALRSGWVR